MWISLKEPEDLIDLTEEDDKPEILPTDIKVTAQLPGMITDIWVEENEHVGKYDLLYTIKAMKLYNNIYSEHEGQVISVLTYRFTYVKTGDVLFVIRPD